jgi:hypothetical protein
MGLFNDADETNQFPLMKWEQVKMGGGYVEKRDRERERERQAD